MKLQDKILG